MVTNKKDMRGGGRGVPWADLIKTAWVRSGVIGWSEGVRERPRTDDRVYLV